MVLSRNLAGARKSKDVIHTASNMAGWTAQALNRVGSTSEPLVWL
jgi:hypothetical protein